ncbi:MAG TPA: glycoside hydrolase family 38 C-terminal domain-containing protein [Tepidisphaeraceae bacterium]|jgi:alpha-mannosidase|nr:glycoside hydrolase family 38 C-terminal domain-containing protein [Tepidisphaeraceae bacterium]
MKTVIHVIPNAHLDPVWLWDWREGLNEALTTIRTVLNLMDEFPELTFVRGEAAIYQHVERLDPHAFRQIRRRIEDGRWDVVGGTVVQMDTNLPCTAVIDRHFEAGTRYFRDRFGRDVTVAWAADSFGHSGGLPDILRRHGITAFACTRPAVAQLPIERSVFHWQGVGGDRVMAYRPRQGWYGCERAEVPARLDHCLKEAMDQGLQNVACFMGLGNHGGGPTRRQILDLLAWRDAHPGVTVRFSGLHQLFDALRAELQSKPDDFVPVVAGELGFTLRGCYSSAATFKFAYRRAEAAVLRAQKVSDAVADVVTDPTSDAGAAHAQLARAWDGLLFNSFHDILPGTSIERAMDEQRQWVGGVQYDAAAAEFAAINDLQTQVDTRNVEAAVGDMPAAVPLLLFNPHDEAFAGYVELEAAVDYRPVFAYQDRADLLPLQLMDGSGRAVAFQRVAVENAFMRNIPWRQRVLTFAELPPRGWTIYDLAWVEGAAPIGGEGAARTTGEGTIANDTLTVTATPGAAGVQIWHNGRTLLADPGLTFALFTDGQGSWGDMTERGTHQSDEVEQWTVKSSRVIESGPYRAALAVHLAGARSEIDLTLALCHGSNVVQASARLFWNERGPRLKLILPAGDRATFDVPGGQITRGPLGEVPGGRWVVIHGQQGDVGFASDSLYNFDSSDGVTRATIARSTPYACDAVPANASSDRMPVQDRGEHAFRFCITPDASSIAREALFLEQPPILQTVPPHPGRLPRSGTIPSNGEQ